MRSCFFVLLLLLAVVGHWLYLRSNQRWVQELRIKNQQLEERIRECATAQTEILKQQRLKRRLTREVEKLERARKPVSAGKQHKNRVP